MMEERDTDAELQEEIPVKFWNDPENILRLIDLIFFYDDNNTLPPS